MTTQKAYSSSSTSLSAKTAFEQCKLVIHSRIEPSHPNGLLASRLPPWLSSLYHLNAHTFQSRVLPVAGFMLDWTEGLGAVAAGQGETALPTGARAVTGLPSCDALFTGSLRKLGPLAGSGPIQVLSAFSTSAQGPLTCCPDLRQAEKHSVGCADFANWLECVKGQHDADPNGPPPKFRVRERKPCLG